MPIVPSIMVILCISCHNITIIGIMDYHHKTLLSKDKLLTLVMPR